MEHVKRKAIRQVLRVLAISVALAGVSIASNVASPSSAALASVTVPLPALQGFSSWPPSWFLLNQPDEFVVTPKTTIAPVR